MALHCPIAWSPATPAPIIKTSAAGIFPAAVIYSFANLSNKLKASMQALYPIRLAMELKVSKA